MSDIVVTGFHHVVLGLDGAVSKCDPMRFLRQRKNRKFMGLQDDMAVVVAGEALAQAGFAGQSLGERAGLFLTVGYIPFEGSDIDPVLDGSLESGRFSMRRFSEDGLLRAHPLLTFRCLPNMPAFHVSLSFDVQGPYLVTYPGTGQLYVMLDEAVAALREGRVDVALLMGVAAQRNFLVTHHLGRVTPSVSPELIADAAGCLVLERAERATERGAEVRASLVSHDVSFDLDRSRAGEQGGGADVGAAELIVRLASSIHAGEATFAHHAHARDGIAGESSWRLA